MGPHDAVELDRVAVLVGVEPPVAVLEAREEAVLDAGVEGLAPNDQPGALGPVGEVDQLGELDHRGPFPVLAFCVMAWCQSSSNPKVSKIALWIWRFERPTTEKPTFLDRQAATTFSVQPAESARITTRRHRRHSHLCLALCNRRVGCHPWAICIATSAPTEAATVIPTTAAVVGKLGVATRSRSRTSWVNCITSHSRSRATFASTRSGLTATGCPTASSMGRSV